MAEGRGQKAEGGGTIVPESSRFGVAHRGEFTYTPAMAARLPRVALLALLAVAGVALARMSRTEPTPRMRGTWKPL